jgi:ethanolamine ammonia-lyase large subunit
MPPVDDLRRLFALANAFKEGDLPLGGTRDDSVREDARQQLLALRTGDIRRTTFVEDGVSDALEHARDRSFDSQLDPLTVAQLKETLLSPTGPAWSRHHRDVLPSEVIAAIAKVMTDAELASVARSLSNPLSNGIGSPGHFGSRIQPNSPGDDEQEILFSILDGLAHECGDVVIGLNPAADDVDTIVRLEQLLERVVRGLNLPTRYCVLSDILKQHQAQARTSVDVGFQSLAGTSKALGGMVGLDVDGILDLARGFDGLYFETGQGSAVTNGADEGVDMVTLESRAYGVARHIQRQTGRWMIVNDVAGFIGPEVFRSPAQLERACLEDLVMARLHGLTMGLDVCATFHMGISPDALRQVTSDVVRRGAPAYLMAVAGNADPMLGYLTTSFREHPVLRRNNGTAVTAAMQQRLHESAATEINTASTAQAVDRLCHLYAQYSRAAGQARPSVVLEDEGRRIVSELRERGFDIAGDERQGSARVDRIYRHARHALYARLDDSVLRDACGIHIRALTRAADRDDYIAHPPAGERLSAEGAATVLRSVRPDAGGIQIVVSDGLNAEAINEHLRSLLPPLRRLLAGEGRRVNETVVVLQNGRVRAGYQVAQLLHPEVLIHVIGERPGTGLNTVSAYVTYGRDVAGHPRWDPRLDHSCTTAVCGIHPQGKPPDTASSEIARTVHRMFEQRRSGVALK